MVGTKFQTFVPGGDPVSTGVKKPQMRAEGVERLVKTPGKNTKANDNVELALAA